MIPAKDIEEKAMGGSLMPEGLADPLTRGELVDLVRFLSELGKVGPYSVSKARLVRTWEVRETAWVPAYSLVSGALPIAEIPVMPHSQKSRGAARCRFDVSTGGKVKLRIQAPRNALLTLDDKDLDLKDELEIDLSPGVHTLAFQIEHVGGRKGDSLRVELEDVPGSRARVQIIGGK